MPRTLATKRERWAFLTSAPADPEAVTEAEAEAGVRGECWLDPETTLSATGATTTNAGAICDGVVPSVPVNKQGGGSLTVIRDLDPETGLPEPEEELYPLVSEFGTELYVVKSTGVPDSEPFESGQPYRLFRVITDEPQDPSNRDGFVREVVPLHVQEMWRGEIAGP